MSARSAFVPEDGSKYVHPEGGDAVHADLKDWRCPCGFPASHEPKPLVESTLHRRCIIYNTDLYKIEPCCCYLSSSLFLFCFCF